MADLEFGLISRRSGAKSVPRIYADKVRDRTIVHAPNHVPGQKPITVGHEYSVLVYLPNREEEREKHWVVPLSVKRVASHQSGPDVGLLQLEEIANHTVFKRYFCISVTDAAYSTKKWVIRGSKFPHVVHIARLRGNRKVYQMPAGISEPLAPNRLLLLLYPTRYNARHD